MLVSLYANFKDLIEASLDLSPDVMHVHVGLLIFLTAAWLIRGRNRFVHALGLVLAACLIGEALDLSYAYKWQGLGWKDGFHSVRDVVGTMFWPTVWVLLGPRPAGADRSRNRREAGRSGGIL